MRAAVAPIPSSPPTVATSTDSPSTTRMISGGANPSVRRIAISRVRSRTLIATVLAETSRIVNVTAAHTTAR